MQTKSVEYASLMITPIESINQRLHALQPLGAGDAQCAECLHLSPTIPGMEVCRQCIADTPEFTAAVNRIVSRAES